MRTGIQSLLVVALVAAGLVGLIALADGGASGGSDAVSADAPATAATSAAAAALDPSPVPVTAPAGTTPTTAVPTTASPTTVDLTATTLSAYLSSFCPSTAHAAVVDRERQRTWLCERGVAVHEMPFTGAISQPDPGTYPVYAKDLRSSSSTSQGVSTMTHFVAFTHGKFRGARIAFHSVPVWSGGGLVQPLESVGDVGRRGESAGCLRMLPDDAVRVWDWLSIGDEVRVIN